MLLFIIFYHLYYLFFSFIFKCKDVVMNRLVQFIVTLNVYKHFKSSIVNIPFAYKS
jgi:hypothetical protein